MKTLLVTGGTGLVGYALKQIIDSYKEYNFIFIGSKDYNLININEVHNMFKKYNPYYVIHLASNVGGLFKNINKPVEMLEDNLLINFNIVKCCHEYKVKKAIMFLSTCIFPDNISYPINEKMLHIGPPHDSNAGYAYAKRMGHIHSEVYNKFYYQNTDPLFVNVIPTNIYGPNDNYNLETAHVIPALIHKCYIAKTTESNFVIGGSGKPLRQFVYSIDIANLLMLILEKYNDREPIILSNNESDEISIKDVSYLIAQEFNMNIENIKFDETKPDGQYKKTASNEKLQKWFPDFKFTNIKDGLRESIKWFNDNYERARL